MRERIGVVGLGKLGWPLAVAFAKAGLTVTGFDVDPAISAACRDRTALPSEPGLAEMLEKTPAERLLVVSSMRELVETNDIVFLIVPTPSMDGGAFDDRFVRQAIRQAMAEGKPLDFVLVSTVMPGTCRQLVKDLECRLVYSPEFVALGSILKGMAEPDATLIGYGPGDEDLAAEVALIWSQLHTRTCELRQMSWSSAELAKLALNSFLAAKITMVSHITYLAHHLPGANAADVLEFAGLDRRIGSSLMRPGLAPGGPCLPRDLRALRTEMERSSGPLLPRFAGRLTKALSDWGQEYLPALVVAWIDDRIARAGLASPTVLCLGWTYKTNTPVEADSPAKEIAIELGLRHSVIVVDFDAALTAKPPTGRGVKATFPLKDLDKIDVVVVAKPDQRHAPLIREALRLGKLVLQCWAEQTPPAHNLHSWGQYRD